MNRGTFAMSTSVPVSGADNGLPSSQNLTPQEASPAPVIYSQAYLRWVLFMLLIVYIFNFVDRSILTVLSQAIKVEFHISDFYLGLLGGPFFAVLYTVCGIPIARLAERRDRVTIISLAVATWSAMTALCGLAGSYAQLALFRVGVGIGEAGYSPPAQSLISDYFPPEKRSTALSIYSLGIPLGGLIGTVAGGWLAQDLGWRMAFVVVGLPGIALAILARLTIKDPPRGHSEKSGALGAGSYVPPLKAVIALLWSKWTFIHVCIAGTLTSFVGYGNTAFALTYFLREFHLDLKTTSLALGLVVGTSAAIGTLAGGLLSDRLGAQDKRWYAWVPAIGLCIAAPITIAAFLQAQWWIAVSLLILPGIFHYTYLGPSFSLTHNMVPPRMRASSTAILLFAMNLIGYAVGPPFVGLLSDFYAGGAFILGDFNTSCPGGVAIAGALPELKAACLQATADGAREAILTNTLIFFWAAGHYFLAAKTLRRDLYQPD
jgi:MFS family permease